LRLSLVAHSGRNSYNGSFGTGSIEMLSKECWQIQNQIKQRYVLTSSVFTRQDKSGEGKKSNRYTKEEMCLTHKPQQLTGSADGRTTKGLCSDA